jgi:hypothetical protein
LALTILISLLTAAIMVVILAIMSNGHRYDVTKNQPRQHRHEGWHSVVEKPPAVLSSATFQLHQNVTCDAFLESAEALEDFFVSTNNALQRSLSHLETLGCDHPDTTWVDLVYWENMEEALQAAQEIKVAQQAQPFLSSINASTFDLQHFTIDFYWWPLRHGDIVEVAKFPLVEDVSSETFVQDAKASNFLLEVTPAAKQRTLSHGYESPQMWMDVVYWTSVQEAKEAAKAMEELKVAEPFLNDMCATSSLFSFDYYQLALLQDFQK